MKYFSTKRTSPVVSFKEAVLKGQPEDRGLYFPASIPMLDPQLIDGLGNMPKVDVAYNVITPYIGSEIDETSLRNICAETVDIDFPLVPITDQISALELFHGPTLAFKDVGARFMSRVLRYFSKDRDRKTLVIVATSGDTGGAVASAFHNIDGIEVVILYPKDKVSRIQELQLTTLGGNVTTLELHSDFDACQTIAKQLLADDDICSRSYVTSANSINVARWLPQQFYYFYAKQRSKQLYGDAAPVACVPSGNFGNLAAGILARKSGLPIRRFIAACNANDVVPRYLNGGEYEPHDSIATLSNAMDVGSPSNWVRIEEICGGRDGISEILSAVSISDQETRSTMIGIHQSTGYILDPHGAVGFSALQKGLRDGEIGFFLETAHPVKFDSVKEILGTQGEIPASVSETVSKQKHAIEVESDYETVRDIVLNRI